MIKVINLKDEMHDLYYEDVTTLWTSPKYSTRKIPLHEGWIDSVYVIKEQNKNGKYLYTRKDHMLINEVLDEYTRPDGIIFKNSKRFFPYAEELIDERHELYQRISRTSYNDVDIHIETGRYGLKGYFKPYTIVNWKLRRNRYGRLTYLSEKMVIKDKIINQEENIIYPAKNRALRTQRNDKGFEEVSWIDADEVADIKETEKFLSFLHMFVRK